MASPENYILGKGKFFYQPYSETARPIEANYVEMGNCPQINISIAEETLDHYSSRGGINKKDKQVTTQIGYTLTPTTDEITPKNLAIFYGGEEMPNGDVRGLTKTEMEYACKYVSDNPVGPQTVWYFNRVKFKGAGDMALIGTDWMQLPLTGEGLSDDILYPQSPFFTIKHVLKTKKITAWAEGMQYAVGDFVTNTGTTYRCKTAHIAAAPFVAANWEAVDPWQANAPVLANDYVLQDDKVYQAPEDFTTGDTFADDDGYWVLAAE